MVSVPVCIANFRYPVHLYTYTHEKKHYNCPKLKQCHEELFLIAETAIRQHLVQLLVGDAPLVHHASTRSTYFCIAQHSEYTDDDYGDHENRNLSVWQNAVSN